MKICRSHAESREGLTAGPPYHILEPSQSYPDGSPREDGKSFTASTTFCHGGETVPDKDRAFAGEISF